MKCPRESIPTRLSSYYRRDRTNVFLTFGRNRFAAIYSPDVLLNRVDIRGSDVYFSMLASLSSVSTIPVSKSYIFSLTR
jgi:hypothetical protein